MYNSSEYCRIRCDVLEICLKVDGNKIKVQASFVAEFEMLFPLFFFLSLIVFYFFHLKSRVFPLCTATTNVGRAPEHTLNSIRHLHHLGTIQSSSGCCESCGKPVWVQGSCGGDISSTGTLHHARNAFLFLYA